MCCFDFSGLKMWPVWAFHGLQCMLLCSARKHFVTDPLSLNGLKAIISQTSDERMCVRNSLRVGHSWATTLKVCLESKELEQRMIIPEPIHPLHSFHIGKENPGWKLWNPSRHNLRHRGRHFKMCPTYKLTPSPFSQKVTISKLPLFLEQMLAPCQLLVVPCLRPLPDIWEEG